MKMEYYINPNTGEAYAQPGGHLFDSESELLEAAQTWGWELSKLDAAPWWYPADDAPTSTEETDIDDGRTVLTLNTEGGESITVEMSLASVGVVEIITTTALPVVRLDGKAPNPEYDQPQKHSNMSPLFEIKEGKEWAAFCTKTRLLTLFPRSDWGEQYAGRRYILTEESAAALSQTIDRLEALSRNVERALGLG